MSVNLEAINEEITDRTDCFYWQTDRAVTPKQAGEIWSDRHNYFSDEELRSHVNKDLDAAGLQVTEILPRTDDSQNNLGNVNSVRSARLNDGRDVVIRLHPRGVNNGYFHVEAAAARTAKERGLPSYETLAVHDFNGGATRPSWLFRHLLAPQSSVGWSVRRTVNLICCTPLATLWLNCMR
jgi:hypothetical protein